MEDARKGLRPPFVLDGIVGMMVCIRVLTSEEVGRRRKILPPSRTEVVEPAFL